MAAKNDSGMVMAWGDNGLEATPSDEVVVIPALPLAPGNKMIPATIRALPNTYGTPRRLVGIATKSQPWPRVRWRDERGKVASCYVRSKAEAADPLFDSLPERSRQRIIAAAP